MRNNLVYGVGINDADYFVAPRINGKCTSCPFYTAWTGMLERCYSPAFKLKHPTYYECSACKEWLSFMKFKSWMETQDWHGKQLDKDLLFYGNKTYSPDACVFVDSVTNSFTLDCSASKGSLPTGVSFHKRDGKFASYCRNPFTKKSEHLGYFTCENEAHLAWRKRKNELACQLADLQSDNRVATALRLRYS